MLYTLENKSFEMNEIPDEVDDLRFCVLDNSDPKDPDYFYIPLIFLESFNSPAILLNIGGNEEQMPLDWCVVVGDRSSGDLEIMRLIDLNDKDFDVFAINPISGYMPEFHNIEIVNVFADVKWHFPRLKAGHILAMPLNMGTKPLCAFFVKEMIKNLDNLDIRHLV